MTSGLNLAEISPGGQLQVTALPSSSERPALVVSLRRMDPGPVRNGKMLWGVAVLLLGCGASTAPELSTAAEPSAPTAPTNHSQERKNDESAATNSKVSTEKTPTQQKVTEPDPRLAAPEAKAVPGQEEIVQKAPHPGELGRIEGVHVQLDDGSYFIIPYSDDGLDMCAMVMVAPDGQRTPHRPPDVREKCKARWAEQSDN